MAERAFSSGGALGHPWVLSISLAYPSKPKRPVSHREGSGGGPGPADGRAFTLISQIPRSSRRH